LGDVTLVHYHSVTAGCSESIEITVNEIAVSDIWFSIRLGWRDFMQQPSHYFFAIILYPFIGIVLWLWASESNTVQLIFPMMTGFALLGPFIAIFLYEISRRLENGLDTSWGQIFLVIYSPAVRDISILSIMLLGLFVTWMISANILFLSLYGPEYPTSLLRFLIEVILTPRGWVLIILGNGIGVCFALIALCSTVVAFPILIDTRISAIRAVQVSMLAVRMNPIPLILWGLVVSLGLLMGVLCVMVGLIIAFPVFGHASWHLYRRVVHVSY
jgi:uncharacterized membrane protein